MTKAFIYGGFGFVIGVLLMLGVSLVHSQKKLDFRSAMLVEVGNQCGDGNVWWNARQTIAGPMCFITDDPSYKL